MLVILVSLFATLATMFGAYIAWRSRQDTKKATDLAVALDLRLHPLELRLNTLETNARHLEMDLEAAITRALQPVMNQLSELDSKMDILWEVQKQVARDGATTLPHNSEERWLDGS